MEIRTRQEGQVLVVALEGELDAYWARETQDALWRELERGHARMALDLTGLTFLSSAGLRVLLQLQGRLSSLRGGLALGNPQPFVREVLDATGFSRALRIFDSVAEAAAAVRPSDAPVEERAPAQQDRTTPEGAFQFRFSAAGTAAPARLRVIGHADDLLFSRASPERLTTLHVGETGYALGVGALGDRGAGVAEGAGPPGGPRGSALMDRLGELLAVPGAAFWLPGDGRQVPDFLTAAGERAQLPLHMLSGLVLEGDSRFTGRFVAADPDGGAELAALGRSLLEWAAGQAGFSGVLGLALRAEIAGLWGVGLKRSPRQERAPAGGQRISHRENIKEWLHFPTEPGYAGHSLLAVGVLVDPARATLPAGALEAAFGTVESQTGRAATAHVHGAVFRPLPELGDGRPLSEEFSHIVEHGDLVGLAHLLPATRLRRAKFALWLTEGVSVER